MENNEQLPKSMQWYFHPDESIRLLRYFQYNLIFDNNIDYTPVYTNNPNIGVVISTYGNLSYVELHLHYLKNINGINKILVHDNCSDNNEQLKSLCAKYNVDFYSPSTPLFFHEGVGNIGDVNSIYQGLLWAKYNNLDILVKFSDKLIPCYEWKTDLITLAKKSNAITFSSYCTKDLYNMRTECIGLNVQAWSKQYPLQCIQFIINNELPILEHIWFHELSKTLSGNNYSDTWINYCKANKYGYLHSGYAMWQTILGTNRHTDENRHKNTLWYMYSKDEDYKVQL